MSFFSRFKQIDYSPIITQLESGDAEQIKKLLWQPDAKQINYLPGAVEMIQKVRTGNKLSVHQTIKKGDFEMVIFSQDITGTKFYPLIFDRKSGKIIGVMQAFSEATEHLSTKDKQSIDHLAQEWAGFSGMNKPR